MTAMKTANRKGTRIAEASRIPAMMITTAAITMAPRAVACCWFLSLMGASRGCKTGATRWCSRTFYR